MRAPLAYLCPCLFIPGVPPERMAVVRPMAPLSPVESSVPPASLIQWPDWDVIPPEEELSTPLFLSTPWPGGPNRSDSPASIGLEAEWPTLDGLHPEEEDESNVGFSGTSIVDRMDPELEVMDTSGISHISISSTSSESLTQGGSPQPSLRGSFSTHYIPGLGAGGLACPIDPAEEGSDSEGDLQILQEELDPDPPPRRWVPHNVKELVEERRRRRR